MSRRRKYYVRGTVGGEEIGPSVKASLESAARTANKMRDQGVQNVRVTDDVGNMISDQELDQKWWAFAERSLIKRRRMDGR